MRAGPGAARSATPASRASPSREGARRVRRRARRARPLPPARVGATATAPRPQRRDRPPRRAAGRPAPRAARRRPRPPDAARRASNAGLHPSPAAAAPCATRCCAEAAPAGPRWAARPSGDAVMAGSSSCTRLGSPRRTVGTPALGLSLPPRRRARRLRRRPGAQGVRGWPARRHGRPGGDVLLKLGTRQWQRALGPRPQQPGRRPQQDPGTGGSQQGEQGESQGLSIRRQRQNQGRRGQQHGMTRQHHRSHTAPQPSNAPLHRGAQFAAGQGQPHFQERGGRGQQRPQPLRQGCVGCGAGPWAHRRPISRPTSSPTPAPAAMDCQGCSCT